LAGQSDLGRIVTEHFEHLELVFSRWVEQLAPLQDDHAASAAASASTREGNRCDVQVAQVHQFSCIWRVDDQGRVAFE
jgi:hypothetical protein